MSVQDIIEPGFIQGIRWLPTRGLSWGPPIDVPNPIEIHLRVSNAEMALEVPDSDIALQVSEP